MSTDLVGLLKSVIEQQKEQMVLLEQTVKYLADPKSATSLPRMTETDPIAVNIIANLPGFIYWKNKKSQYMGNNNLAKLSGLNDRREMVGKTEALPHIRGQINHVKLS